MQPVSSVTREADGCHLHLQGDLSIHAAEDLRQAFLGVLDQNVPVVVRGDAVERMDTAALQLLLALQRDLGEQHRLTLRGFPPPVAGLIRLAGLPLTLED